MVYHPAYLMTSLMLVPTSNRRNISAKKNRVLTKLHLQYVCNARKFHIRR